MERLLDAQRRARRVALVAELGTIRAPATGRGKPKRLNSPAAHSSAARSRKACVLPAGRTWTRTWPSSALSPGSWRWAVPAGTSIVSPGPSRCSRPFSTTFSVRAMTS